MVKITAYGRTSFEHLAQNVDRLADVFVTKKPLENGLVTSSVVYVFDNGVLKVVVGVDTKKPHTYYLQTPVIASVMIDKKKDIKLVGYLEEASFVEQNGSLKDNPDKRVCVKSGYVPQKTRLYPHTSCVSEKVTDAIKATLQTTPIIYHSLKPTTSDLLKRCLLFNVDPNFKSIAIKSDLESQHEEMNFVHYMSIVPAVLPDQRLFEEEKKLKHTNFFVAMHAFGFLLGFLSIFMSTRSVFEEDPLTATFLVALESTLLSVCFVGIGRDSLIAKEAAQERCLQTLNSRTRSLCTLSKFQTSMLRQEHEDREEEYERIKERVKQITQDIMPLILTKNLLALHGGSPKARIRIEKTKKKVREAAKRRKAESAAAQVTLSVLQIEEGDTSFPSTSEVHVGREDLRGNAQDNPAYESAAPIRIEDEDIA